MSSGLMLDGMGEVWTATGVVDAFSVATAEARWYSLGNCAGGQS